MPPAYVKANVKRGKTDAAGAEAICGAVTRPTMRFVPPKTEERQAGAAELRVRDLLVRQRTQVASALRGHLAEFGVVVPKGIWKVAEPAAVVRDDGDDRLPASAREALLELVEQLEGPQARIERLETRPVRCARADETARRLATIPGVGVITRSALLAMAPDPRGFGSGRRFAAWLGLTPQPHSSGGKERLGRISKRGNTMLRALFIRGATARLRHARRSRGGDGWLAGLAARRPFEVAAVALANKMARIARALLAKGGTYGKPAAARPAAVRDCPAAAAGRGRGAGAAMRWRDRQTGCWPDRYSPRALERASLIRRQLREAHRGPRPSRPRREAVHMTAPVLSTSRSSTLTRRGHPHTGCRAGGGAGSRSRPG